MNGPPLGRHDVVVVDEASGSVIALEFVFRSEDSTVWFDHRTLAVMDREHFATWLSRGGDLMVDDLTWTTEGRTTSVTIDGHRSYVLDDSTLAQLMHRTAESGLSVETLATPISAYVTVLGITVVNPTTVIYFVALIVGAAPDQINDWTSRLAFVAGVGLASAAWQVMLAGGGSVLGRVISGPSARRWTTVVGGCVVVLLAVKSMVGG